MLLPETLRIKSANQKQPQECVWTKTEGEMCTEQRTCGRNLEYQSHKKKSTEDVHE